MAFKQYTRCIEPTDYSSRIRFITIASLLAGAPAAAVAVAMNHPICMLIALQILALAGLVAYYHNWLYNRLICLGGDKDCVAAIVSISEPNLTLNLLDRDTDVSLNLLLENNDYGPSIDGMNDAQISALKSTLQSAAEASTPFGHLVAPQPGVTAIGRNTPGHTATDGQPNTNDGHTHQLAAVLHAEFEGDGMYKMLLTCKVLLALEIFALIACIFLPWPADAILAGILAAFALLALLISSLAGLAGEGSPSDVGAGELTDNTSVVNGVGVGADIVFVQGTWVYDPLHEGWNEIHPIKICTKVGKWDGEWPADNVILRMRHGFDVAQSPDTISNQAQPQYQWQLHPGIDGCVVDIIT